MPQGPTDSETARGGKKLASVNDDVAAILKGLKLDKSFFTGRLNAGVLKSLSPIEPGSSGESTRTDGNSRKSRTGSRGSDVDIDIYLNEALMPVLAQALDALARQITKMQALGDKLDNRVRDRFNPITWLAQQLLRRHPRAATTPRRMHIYRNFRDWSDYERGRRELLRCKSKIEEVFNGFKLNNSVGKNTLTTVIASIDEKFRFRGALKSNAEIQNSVSTSGDSQEPGSPAPPTGKRRRSVLGGGGVTFDQFWYSFANAIMKNDVISFSAIEEGRNRIQMEEEENARREEAAKLEEERRQRAEEEHQRLLVLYETLYPKLQQDQVLKAIMDEGKILTGDFLKPTDSGFEIQVSPHGLHVVLLQELLVLLGFEARPESRGGEEYTRSKSKSGKTLRTKVKHETVTPSKEAASNPSSPSKKNDKKLDKQKSVAEPAKKDTDATAEDKQAPSPEVPGGEQHWWTPALKQPWKVLQQLHGVKDPNGIVEREVLQAVTGPPENFIKLKKKVETQFEVQAENGADEEDDPISAVAKVSDKPSFEELATQLNMTRGRLDFFHELFQNFVQQIDPNKECLYPDCPASLDKQTMYNMMCELQPEITQAEFEARFRRIDTDGSGLIEFDEFVAWMHDDDVAVVGSDIKKPSFEDLAQDCGIPLDLVKYIYDCFVNELEEGVVDGYPDKPATMPHDTIWMLANILTPSIQKKDFDIAFKQVDVEKKGACTFDEVLETLDFQALPKELKEKYGVEGL